MNKTLQNIQALRGAAVLSVLLFHAAGIENKYAGDQLLGNGWQIGAAGVDLFFVISGYIMVHLAGAQAAGLRPSLVFLRARATRIYPTYWAVTLALYIAWLQRPDIMQDTPRDWAFLLKSLLLLPQEPLPLLSVGWTLVHEMYFYLVFALMLLVAPKYRPFLLLAWAGASLIGALTLNPPQQNPLLYLLANPLTLEFCAGCALALLPRRNNRLLPPVLLFALGLTSLLGVWAWWGASGHPDFPAGRERVWCFLLPAALLLWAALQMEQQGQLLPCWLQRLGDASYSLYLTHVLIMAMCGKLWQSVANPQSLQDNLLWLPAILSAALIGGFACHHWLEKPLLRLLHRRS